MIGYKIAVALACHNRREKTLKCLASLFGQILKDEIELTVILVDDGSCDGTSDAVEKLFPSVCLLQGNGDLYWNGAMHKALEEALKEPHDFHFWLNDDVLLYPTALQQLISTYENMLLKTNRCSIVVGAFCDPESHTRSYGGLRRSSRLHPLKFAPVFNEEISLPCHTFEANGVLVPAAVFKKIGIIESRFSGFQNTGDTEYGLRATMAGMAIYSSPGFIGECETNADGAPGKNSKSSFKQRWEVLRSPKGLQAGVYFLYARRHGGRFWPVFWLLPTVRSLLGLFTPGSGFPGVKRFLR